MKQANLIQCNFSDTRFVQLLKENNQNPQYTKSLIIKFNSAKITHVVIKLNRKPNNIVAMLANLQNQTKKANDIELEYVKFNHFTNENQKVIYNCNVNTNIYYTYLQIKFDQNDVAFFNIQLYGYEAQQQKSLDNLQVQPIQFGTKINLKNQKKDTKDRHQQEINKFSQQEKQDLEDAVKNSLISYQTKEMNNKQIIESIKYAEYFQQQQEYEFQDLGIEIEKEDNDLQKYQYEQKKQPQLMSENLGYTDNKNVTNFGFKRNTQEKKGYQQQQQQQQQNNVDPIKLHLMTKYKAEDINEAFMKMHQLLEETGGVKRFLENVMFN